MIKLKKLGIAGTALFKSQVFTFEEGISYIYGLNHAGRIKDGNGNAAGKSRFFSRIGELVYDDPVVGTRADKDKRGKSFLEYEYAGRIIKIMSSFKGRSENFTIWIDGKQSKYNTPAKAKPALRRLFPPTRDDFDSYIYLDSRVPHPLVRGSSTERKRFFTSFFGLDKIDAERKVFAAELSKLTKTRAAYEELSRSYTALSKDLLTADKRAALKTKHTELNIKYKALAAKADKAQAVKQVLTFADAAKDQLAALKLVCPDLNEDAFTTVFDNATEAVRVAEHRYRQAQKYQKYRDANKAYTEAVAELGQDVGDASDFQADAEAYEQALPKYQSIKQQLADLERPSDVESCKKPKSDLEELRVEQARIKTQLSHAHEFKDGECYACGQSVKIKNPKVLNAELAEVQRLLEQHKFYEEYLEVTARNKELFAKYESLMDRQHVLKTKLAATKEAFTAYQVLRYLNKPQPFEGPKLRLGTAEEALSQAKETLSLLTYCRPHLDVIVKAQQLSKEDRKLAAFDSSGLQDLQDELSEIRTAMAVHKSIRVRAQEMKARLAEMEHDLKEEEALRLLIKGYSDKAIKRMAIEAVSQRLMQLVNHYAHQVFVDYTFEFKWDTQIQLLVHRPNGETSDVRKLSGAEAMLFTLVLVPSLLAFTPARKRVSAIIMDEPSASFSESTIQAFHELLPQINKLIPSIIVITPKSEERFAAARNYTVLRTKQGATIVDGHPSEHS